MFFIRDLFLFSDANKREINQDLCFYLNFDGAPNLENKLAVLCVMDGVSSANGKAAADIAARAMRPVLAQLPAMTDELLECSDEEKEEQILRLLRSAILQADLQLRQAQQPGQIYGTTITLATVFDERVFAANVGDSPAYLLRMSTGGGVDSILPLFECHNQAGRLVHSGQLTPVQALTHPGKNLLLRMAGGQRLYPHDIYTTTQWLGQSDLLLLGSDGALSVLPQEELIRLVNEHSPVGLAQMTAALFEQVQASSSTDNFTLLAQWLDSN